MKPLFSPFTLSEASGCKQVCPPAVKLQKALKASEVQPKFGSTQKRPGSQTQFILFTQILPFKELCNIITGALWTLTIIKLVLTVEQILADTSRVLPCSQRLFDALDHGAEVTERLEDLHVLVW